MTRVYKRSDARSLGLPGRNSFEIASGALGTAGVTLRLVEIPVAPPGEPRRPPHHHEDFEECIYVLSGRGITEVEGRGHPLAAGDTIVIAAGERHATRNTGDEPLVLLCFFPVASIAGGTHEPGVPA